MKTSKTNVLSAILVTGAVAGLMLISNIVMSSATLQSNDAGMIATTTTTTTQSSNDQLIMQIDAAITAIKSGDNDNGTKQLLESEKLLEDVPSASDAEKRIEAAIEALKDGDSNGSISQAEEAKKLLTS